MTATSSRLPTGPKAKPPEPSVANAVRQSATEKLLLTPEEAAYRLSVGRTAVYAAIASGRLRSVRLGRSRRISVSALDAFVDKLAED